MFDHRRNLPLRSTMPSSKAFRTDLYQRDTPTATPGRPRRNLETPKSAPLGASVSELTNCVHSLMQTVKSLTEEVKSIKQSTRTYAPTPIFSDLHPGSLFTPMATRSSPSVNVNYNVPNQTSATASAYYTSTNRQLFDHENPASCIQRIRSKEPSKDESVSHKRSLDRINAILADLRKAIPALQRSATTGNKFLSRAAPPSNFLAWSTALLEYYQLLCPPLAAYLESLQSIDIARVTTGELTLPIVPDIQALDLIEATTVLKSTVMKGGDFAFMVQSCDISSGTAVDFYFALLKYLRPNVSSQRSQSRADFFMTPIGDKEDITRFGNRLLELANVVNSQLDEGETRLQPCDVQATLRNAMKAQARYEDALRSLAFQPRLDFKGIISFIAQHTDESECYHDQLQSQPNGNQLQANHVHGNNHGGRHGGKSGGRGGARSSSRGSDRDRKTVISNFHQGWGACPKPAAAAAAAAATGSTSQGLGQTTGASSPGDRSEPCVSMFLNGGRCETPNCQRDHNFYVTIPLPAADRVVDQALSSGPDRRSVSSSGPSSSYRSGSSSSASGSSISSIASTTSTSPDSNLANSRSASAHAVDVNYGFAFPRYVPRTSVHDMGFVAHSAQAPVDDPELDHGQFGLEF